MKGFRFVIVLTLGMSIGLLASGSLEVSQGVSAIAAVPRTDANGVQGRHQRAFIQKRGWIEPHERKPMKSGRTLTSLMAEVMGQECESPASRCKLKGPKPLHSTCLCEGDTETGRVELEGDERNERVENEDQKAIDIKSKSKTTEDE